jgi:prepilin-type N-terminal cleavage/methylation domain-containing protein
MWLAPAKGMVHTQRGFSLIELVMTVGLIAVVTAIVIPITDASLDVNRLKGDATALRNLVGLAKMRASSQSTRARVYADLNANSFALEVWDRTTNTWVTQNGARPLATGVSFGFGALATSPLDPQLPISMSPSCTAGLTAANAIANTACITFNSRGLPVDADGVLFAGHALYLRGDFGVYGTTVTATPLIRLWSSPNNYAVWTRR